MSLVDLTLPMHGPGHPGSVARLETVMIRKSMTYIATRYDFAHDSMQGTYIDFPGHVVETDDGTDAGNYPLAKLAGVPSAVIHLDRSDGSGSVSAEELQCVCPPLTGCGAMIVNALGPRRFDDIVERSVYLGTDAVEWICGTGIHLLVSDIYESPPLHGVFPKLFAAHILTVCYPINLHLLTQPRVRLWALPMRIPGVNQLPCRALAEMTEG
jgi:kynurenine formamidase